MFPASARWGKMGAVVKRLGESQVKSQSAAKYRKCRGWGWGFSCLLTWTWGCDSACQVLHYPPAFVNVFFHFPPSLADWDCLQSSISCFKPFKNSRLTPLVPQELLQSGDSAIYLVSMLISDSSVRWRKRLLCLFWGERLHIKSSLSRRQRND